MTHGEQRPLMYTPAQRQAVDEHVDRFFGEPSSTFQELYSPDIQVNISIIAPSPEHPWTTLATVGAGAAPMNVPIEASGEVPDRAEYLICLPPNWRFIQDPQTGEIPEEQYWPIRLLKDLSRLPVEQGSWISGGDTISWDEPFPNTDGLCAALLLGPYQFEPGAQVAELPEGEEVAFYEAVPLHRAEAEFANLHGADALIDQLEDVVGDFVEVGRPDTCA